MRLTFSNYWEAIKSFRFIFEKTSINRANEIKNNEEKDHCKVCGTIVTPENNDDQLTQPTQDRKSDQEIHYNCPICAARRSICDFMASLIAPAILGYGIAKTISGSTIIPIIIYAGLSLNVFGVYLLGSGFVGTVATRAQTWASQFDTEEDRIFRKRTLQNSSRT